MLAYNSHHVKHAYQPCITFVKNVHESLLVKNRTQFIIIEAWFTHKQYSVSVVWLSGSMLGSVVIIVMKHAHAGILLCSNFILLPLKYFLCYKSYMEFSRFMANCH